MSCFLANEKSQGKYRRERGVLPDTPLPISTTCPKIANKITRKLITGL